MINFCWKLRIELYIHGVQIFGGSVDGWDMSNKEQLAEKKAFIFGRLQGLTCR